VAVVINEMEVRAEPEAPTPPETPPATAGTPRAGDHAQEVIVLVEHHRARQQRLRAH
jgi:hypothetical protein